MYRRVLFNFHVYNYQSAVKVSQWLISTLLCINTYIRIYIYNRWHIYIYNRWHIRCIPRCDDSGNLTCMGWPKWYILGSTQESYSVEVQWMALEDESHPPNTVLHITVPNMCKSSSKSCFLFNMKGKGIVCLKRASVGSWALPFTAEVNRQLFATQPQCDLKEMRIPWDTPRQQTSS